MSHALPGRLTANEQAERAIDVREWRELPDLDWVVALRRIEERAMREEERLR